jgi:hypothetical protein
MLLGPSPPSNIRRSIAPSVVGTPASHVLAKDEGLPDAAPVAEWLATLGLSEYTDRFAENDVDVSVVHLLTDQDLKELGVSLYCPAELPSSGDRVPKMATYATFPGAAAAFSTAGTRRCLERQLSYRSKLSPEDPSLIV